MPSLERFLSVLRSSGDRKLVLASDSEPLSVGPEGERPFGERLVHRELTALIEEILPPAKFADLVLMEPVSFDLTVAGGELAVRVVPGPSIWRAIFTVKGDRLGPLPAPSSAGEPREADSAPATSAASANPKSWSELERLIEPPEPDDGRDAAQGGGGKEPRGPSAASAPPAAPADPAEPEASEPEEEPELAALVPRPPDAEAPPAGEAPATERPPPRERAARSSRPSLEGALATLRDTGEVEVLVTSEAEERSRRKDAFTTGSTVQLSVEDLAVVAASTVSVASEDDARRGAAEGGALAAPRPAPREEALANRVTVQVPRPAPLGQGSVGPDPAPGGASPASEGLGEEAARPRTPSGAFATVEPIEIDLREDDVPTVPIAELDRLLDRAWRAGATAVLLRDHRAPAMGLAGRISPLPGGQADDGRLVHELLDLAASPSHVTQLDIEGFCRFVYRPGGSATLVRCTLVRDGGAIAAWLRRIGDEHLPVHASRWLPASVRNVIPETGLVLVAGSTGQGKTTTATALAALCHQAMDQTLVVADPLERRLPDDSVGILQRQIPEDVPNAGRAIGDALRLEARLVLVDVPRPEAIAVDLLALAGQGRLVIATWTAPGCASAVEALMDALPADMPQVERARRARNLRSVVAVRLIPARERGVLPIFETLRINHVVLSAVTEARLGQHAGTGAQELVSLSFDASFAALQSRGLI